MRRAAIIGAGKTGRGFLARLLRDGGDAYGEIVFIDKNPDLVARLNAAGSYRVSFFGGVRTPTVIDRFRAYTWEDAPLTDALAQCGVVFVAVGGQNLFDVAASLERHPECAPEAVITAENASHPSKTLREGIARPMRVSEGTVFCTTIEDSGLDILSENYPCFQFDGDVLPGFDPAAETLRPVCRFNDFLTRKLYTYNAASCVIAYLGWMKGYTDYASAANDPEILNKLDRNYAVTNRVLCRRFGYDEKDQLEFAMLSRTKFTNRTITDSVSRNARDPQRKLAAGERLMGPLRLMYEYSEDASVLEETVAAALRYDDPASERWKSLQSELGPEGILAEICGVSRDEPAFGRIMNLYNSAGR